VDYVEVFNSDNDKFGGSGKINKGVISPVLENWNGQPYHISISLQSLSIIL